MTQTQAIILIVEDELAVLDAIAFTLGHEGYKVLTAATGDQGLRQFQEHHPDLVILDLLLPDCSGIDVCRGIRLLGDAPILFLTARDQLENKVEAFESGADDYLAKPFRYQELVLRVKALLRRRLAASGQAPLSWAGIVLNPSTHRVTYRGETLTLALREYQLLELLLRRPHHVFSRQQILETVWGWDADSDSNALEVQVSSLRAKLGDHNRKLIRTVRGVGYSLG